MSSIPFNDLPYSSPNYQSLYRSGISIEKKNLTRYTVISQGGNRGQADTFLGEICPEKKSYTQRGKEPMKHAGTKA